ncbi:MAG TPA: T9SS type A sorting domain-containing protein [Flavipsychrobacter sp.]|nr:T9SS type A sorting domain-containing protein [Flavipsychrobacter sp.]
MRVLTLVISTFLASIGVVRATNYYPINAIGYDNVSNYNNWTTDPGGIPMFPKPLNFSTAGDVFYLNNNVTNPYFTGNWTIANGVQVIVTNTYGVTGLPGATLLVGTGSTFDMGGNPFILKSNSVATAAIGNTTGSILNATNVTVERYMTATRGWRLVAAPLNASNAPTILNSWQEGVKGGNPNPGFGTWVTSPYADNLNGYDGVSTTASVKHWNGVAFDSVANTATTKVTDHNGAYFLFVRGPKSVTGIGTPDSTVLRMTGAINIGTQSNVGIIGTTQNVSLIPNPFASSIDYQQVYNGNPGAASSDFFIYDASLGTIGAYRTVTRVANNIYHITPYVGTTPPNSNNSARYIRSGQSFFINGKNTLNITEAMKVGYVSPNFNVFKTSQDSVTEQDFSLALSSVQNNAATLLDGIRVKFDANYSSNSILDDATKLENITENIAIENQNQRYSIERRSLIANGNDSVQLRFWNNGVKNYQFDFEATNFDPSISVLLVDKYIGVTQLNNAASSQYSFAVDNNAASYDPHRFQLVFGKAALSSKDVMTNKSNFSVFPNPVLGRTIQLQYHEIKAGDYTVNLYNTLGVLVYSQTLSIKGDGVSQLTVPATAATGMYTLQVTNNNYQELKAVKILIAE